MRPAVPTNEMATEIARNVKHSHCVMRRSRESGRAKPLANAASNATDSGPTTLVAMFWRTYTQAHGVAKLIMAPVKAKLTIHSDSSRIWG